MKKSLAQLVAKAMKHQITAEEQEAQRRSFVYGNTHLSNPNVTREMVDKAANDNPKSLS